MPAAIKAGRTTHTPEALRALTRSGKDATQNARLPMAASGLEGVGRAEAGRMVGMDRQAVRDWLHRYNAEGLEELRDRPRGGTACFLDDAQLAVVRGWMESGPDVDRDGVVRWRVRDILRKIEAAFVVALCGRERSPAAPKGGVSLRFGAPGAPAGCAGARSAFRSGFRSLVTARLRSAFGAGGAARPVEVRFQDEARVDRKGMMSRLWVRRGARPRVVRAYRYLFGAACGARGKAVGPVSEQADTTVMNAHSEAIRSR